VFAWRAVLARSQTTHLIVLTAKRVDTFVEFSNKVAIVTGAGSGIGAEVVRLLREQGARVVAVDLRPGDVEESGTAGKLVRLTGDVALESTAEAYAKTAIEAFGRVDVMINNAGVPLQRALHETTPDEWDRTLDVNVKSIYWSARVVIPIMKRQGAGLFLNTGSISSVVGIEGQGAYAASKGAVIQLTRQMAIEYARDGIRANAVCPGTVDTPLLHTAAAQMPDPAAFLKGLADAHPIGRIASAEEIARFVVFLSSDHARFINGAVLMIDGGYTAK
jgi:NAD(P)-dependent dehydrogenase (short-subunit alcohol dehydrogenase family)